MATEYTTREEKLNTKLPGLKKILNFLYCSLYCSSLQLAGSRSENCKAHCMLDSTCEGKLIIGLRGSRYY